MQQPHFAIPLFGPTHNLHRQAFASKQYAIGYFVVGQ